LSRESILKKIIILLFILVPVLYSQNLSNASCKTVNGKRFSFSDHLDGKVHVVLFWATWCLPCHKELQAVNNLLSEYDEQDVQVFAISLDEPRSLAKVKVFTRKHQYDFTWLLDSDKKLSQKFLVENVPHSMIADQTGKIVYSHTGYRKGDELELKEKIDELLGAE